MTVQNVKREKKVAEYDIKDYQDHLKQRFEVLFIRTYLWGNNRDMETFLDRLCSVVYDNYILGRHRVGRGESCRKNLISNPLKFLVLLKYQKVKHQRLLPVIQNFPMVIKGRIFLCVMMRQGFTFSRPCILAFFPVPQVNGW